MFRQIILAAVAAGLVAATVSVASSQGRHHSGFYAPPHGYSSGERVDPTNTNGF